NDGLQSSSSFDCGRQARPLHARLIDHLRRENEVIRIRDCVRVARLPQKCFGQTIATAELAQIILATQLVKNSSVVQVRELMVYARRKSVILGGRADGLYERRYLCR